MQHFETLAALKEWCADHTGPECVDLFNLIPGVRPVARFENRDIAATRIWRAMSQPVVEAKEPAAAKPISAPKKRAKTAKAKKAAAPSKDGGRVADVVKMISRANGASLEELMERFGWQKHSARGFMSTLASKHGVSF